MTPPSRWGVVAAFGLVGAATQLLWLTYAGVTTVTAQAYGVSENAVGWLAQVFPLLYVVLAIRPACCSTGTSAARSPSALC